MSPTRSEELADLARRNAHLAVLARVAELAGEVTDLPAFFTRASAVVRPVAGYVGCAIFVVDEAAGDLVRVHLDDGGPPELEARIRRIPAATPIGETVRTRVARVTAIPYPGATPAIIEALPFRALAWVPLVARSRGVGVLVAAYDAAPETAQGSLELLSSVGAHFASALESHELLGALRRRVDEQTLLLDVARASSQLDPALVLEAALRRACTTLRADVAAAWLREDERLVLQSSVGLDEAATAAVRELGLQGSLGLAVERRAPVRVHADDVLAPHLPGTGRVAPGPAIVVPFVAKAGAVGALVLVRAGGAAPFDDGEAALLSSLGAQLGVAVDSARIGLENAELYADARRRAEETGLLHEVGRSLVETLDLEQVLQGGVRSLARIVDAPAAYLALATPDGRELELRAYTGEADAEARIGRRMPLGEGGPTIAPLVYQLREPVLIEDADRDPRVSGEMRRLTGARAYLGLPLVVHDRVIGTVVIVETRAPRRFTPAEVERAAAVANQLAVGVENARLYEDLRRSYAQLARAQQQLVQGERLAALGELSAVVAHEVRNPLGVIFNSMGSLRRLVRPTGDARMLFDIVEEEAERLNRIVGDLLDFARPSTPDARPELLGRIAEDAVAAAVLPAADRIEVVREIEPELPALTLDGRLVRQAILNIAVNAVQAMPRGGRLTVRARRDGAAVLVELEDTGVGIPDEVRERIFEPFFTTKASGTGLGLAVVRRIVEGHGGAVRVRSTPGAGTTFALRFPLDGEPVENDPAMR